MVDRDVVIGDAWASSSTNCVPFRHEAIIPVNGGSIVSFYDAAGNVVLQRLDANLGLQRRLTVVSPVAPHDAHTCISLGVDPAGALHAAFGAHSSVAYHVRVPPTLEGPAPEAVPLEHDARSRITYPAFIRQPASEQLMLLYREGGPWSGELRVKRWDQRADGFVDDADALISGRTCQPTTGPYINSPVMLPDGRIAFFCVWRLDRHASAAGDVVNVGIDLVLADADLRHLSSLDGIGLARPVTPVHAPRAYAVPFGGNLINQAGAAAGPDGAPMALTYWNDVEGIPQYHLLWQAAGCWRATAISRFSSRFKLAGAGTLPLPHSRPTLLVRRDATALCIFRSGEHGNRLMLTMVGKPYDNPRNRRTVVLLDEDLGHYEPVLDMAAFTRGGSLVMYVQACRQGQGDLERDTASAPARLVHWSPRQVAAWQPRRWFRPF